MRTYHSVRERKRSGTRAGIAWDGAASLRAAVFGVNEVLISNSVGHGLWRPWRLRLFLLAASRVPAGAFSWGGGNVAMPRRRGAEQQIALEKQELELSPKEEEEELSLIYQAKGIPEKEASGLARRIVANPATALDTLVREELGLDPSDLGAPWGAALSSFFAFVTGAIIPVLPY